MWRLNANISSGGVLLHVSGGVLFPSPSTDVTLILQFIPLPKEIGKFLLFINPALLSYIVYQKSRVFDFSV